MVSKEANLAMITESQAVDINTLNQVNLVLDEALMDGKVQHPDGTLLDVTANISLANGEALRRFVCNRRPKLVIEIGMAYGVSTLQILAGLLEAGGDGRLISIDPYLNWDTGHKVALNQVERAGVAHLHEHRRDMSQIILPAMLAEGVSPDFIYIDGRHNFEYVFTDLFYADQMLPPNGVVAFNDAGWRPVHKVIQFVKKFRKYEELDVGLEKTFRSRNLLFSIAKRLQGRSTHDRYFRKIEDWDPPFGWHAAF